jgi:hypothetical protein
MKNNTINVKDLLAMGIEDLQTATKPVKEYKQFSISDGKIIFTGSPSAAKYRVPVWLKISEMLGWKINCTVENFVYKEDKYWTNPRTKERKLTHKKGEIGQRNIYDVTYNCTEDEVLLVIDKIVEVCDANQKLEEEKRANKQ